VKAQVAQHTKILQAQVSQLTNTLNGLKNMPLGAQKSRALPHKKKDSTLRAAKPPLATRQAAVAGSDMPTSTTRPPHGRNNKPKKKKRKPKYSSS
jgi:hypothetical protein